VRIAVKTIAGGFVGGGESGAARKRYVRCLDFETKFVGQTSVTPVPDISFTNCDVKIVLIDLGSSADIIYWEAFKAMQLSNEHLMLYNGTLVGFAGERVEVMGYTTLLTTFGENENPKTIKVKYLVVKTPFTSYNIIIGRPAFNALGVAMSSLYLSMKYPLDDGRIGTIRGDQALARWCYESSLKIKHRSGTNLEPSRPNTHKR
jgi:hypothetical protein